MEEPVERRLESEERSGEENNGVIDDDGVINDDGVYEDDGDYDDDGDNDDEDDWETESSSHSNSAYSDIEYVVHVTTFSAMLRGVEGRDAEAVDLSTASTASAFVSIKM